MWLHNAAHGDSTGPESMYTSCITLFARVHLDMCTNTPSLEVFKHLNMTNITQSSLHSRSESLGKFF